MFYIGIDIAKNTHEAAILSDSGDLVGSTLKVANTTTGAQKLLDCLAKAGVLIDNAVIGMEATGHFSGSPKIALSVFHRTCIPELM